MRFKAGKQFATLEEMIAEIERQIKKNPSNVHIVAMDIDSYKHLYQLRDEWEDRYKIPEDMRRPYNNSLYCKGALITCYGDIR